MILFINGEKKAEVLKVLYDYAKRKIYYSFNMRDFNSLEISVDDAKVILKYHNDGDKCSEVISIEQIKGVPLDLFFYKNTIRIDVSGFEVIFGHGIAYKILKKRSLLAGLSGLLDYDNVLDDNFSVELINAIEAFTSGYEDINLVTKENGRYFIESANKSTIVTLAAQLSCFDLTVFIQNNFFSKKVNSLEIIMPEAPAQSFIPHMGCR